MLQDKGDAAIWKLEDPEVLQLEREQKEAEQRYKEVLLLLIHLLMCKINSIAISQQFNMCVCVCTYTPGEEGRSSRSASTEGSSC